MASKDSNFDALTPEEVRMFCGSRTSLEDIQAAGWRIEHSSGGSWWWRDNATGRIFIPHWVLMIEDLAERTGALRVQNNIKDALGIKRKE